MTKIVEPRLALCNATNSANYLSLDCLEDGGSKLLRNVSKK